MKLDVQKFLALKKALINEKARIEARLAQISKVLGGEVSIAASTPASTGKRKFSEATKAKMRASQKARWAKLKGKVDSDAAPVAPVAKKAKRNISPEAKARMVAGAKKRWAKVNADKAKKKE